MWSSALLALVPEAFNYPKFIYQDRAPAPYDGGSEDGASDGQRNKER